MSNTRDPLRWRVERHLAVERLERVLDGVRARRAARPASRTRSVRAVAEAEVVARVGAWTWSRPGLDEVRRAAGIRRDHAAEPVDARDHVRPCSSCGWRPRPSSRAASSRDITLLRASTLRWSGSTTIRFSIIRRTGCSPSVAEPARVAVRAGRVDRRRARRQELLEHVGEERRSRRGRRRRAARLSCSSGGPSHVCICQYLPVASRLPGSTTTPVLPPSPATPASALSNLLISSIWRTPKP